MIKKEKAEKLIILFIIGLSAFVDILRIFVWDFIKVQNESQLFVSFYMRF